MRIPILAILVVSAALIGCRMSPFGGSPENSSYGKPPVDVVLQEFEILMPRQLGAGPATFRVTNRGTMQHSFEIEGQGTERKLDEPLEPGETETLQVDLEPGQYRVYCPVSDHTQRGMSFQLQVTE